jgi:allophanate hydrolase subunit 2
MAEMISEGVPRGAVQALPGSELVILLADHQTTGGYPVSAVVASVDMWRVAQLRPGDRVRFDSISLRSAVHLLGSFQERLRASRTSPSAGSIFAPAAEVMLGPGMEERLMRGFLEWSDEDDGQR